MIAFDNSRVYLSIGGAPLMYLIIRNLVAKKPKFYSKCDILQEKHQVDRVILRKIIVQIALFCKKCLTQTALFYNRMSFFCRNLGRFCPFSLYGGIPICR